MKPVTRREFLRMVSGGAAAAGIAAAGLVRSPAVRVPGVGPLGRIFAPAPAWRRRSLPFLHSFEATGRYWRGLEKAGLIRPACGVRLNHSPYGDDTRRFNAVGGSAARCTGSSSGAGAISSWTAWWAAARGTRTISTRR